VTRPRYPSADIRFSIEHFAAQATALIDSVCDIELVVPARLVFDLPPPPRTGRAETASGERLSVPAYQLRLELTAQPGTFDAWAIALGDEYLLGLPAINHFRVTLDHGQRLVIER